MNIIKPLLAFDIGNTNITAGVFEDERLLRCVNIPTACAEKCRGALRRIVAKDARGIIICSVVPAATLAFCRCLRLVSPLKPVIVGKKGMEVPLKNLYRRPKEVGQDRLVNAYAAMKLFGAPLISVDYGTAVTFDALSGRKEYLGGLILPGMRMQLRALYDGTALLPKVKLRAPGRLLGRDTQESILSGVVHGMAALSGEICAGIKKQTGGKTVVIGTGGDIGLIGRYSRVFDHIEPDLTLKGLQLLFEHFRAGKKLGAGC